MRLATLLDGLDVSCEGFDPGAIDIAGLTERSGEVAEGSLFIARRGERFDAMRYIPEAIRAGASAVLVDSQGKPDPIDPSRHLIRTRELARATAIIAERFYGNPSASLGVAGVTGTNGKTTVAHAVRHILNQGSPTCGLIGTVETDDGLASSPATLTTPFAIDLSGHLRRMLEAGRTRAVVEASSHALVQGRVGAIRFDVGVFTNLSGDHLDFHGSMEAYANAKATLFARLPRDGVAVVNADDGWCERITGATRAKIIRCGIKREQDGELDGTVEIISASLRGITLDIRAPFGEMRVGSPLVGAHNAMNLLQASCAAFSLGADADDIRSGIETFRGVLGRLERVSHSPTVFVDFAHTDDALRTAIAGLRDAMHTGQRLIVVFGCGGDRDRSKRPRMGEAACLGDLAVLTSDNPRTEEPMRIIEDVRAGMDPAAPTLVIADRREAILQAIENAGPRDVVLIAGKGHEREQILPDGRGGVRRIAFDDAAVAREALDHAKKTSAHATRVGHP